MPRSRNDDCHYEEVEHFGITVQLKQIEPDGNLYVEHRHFDDRFRKSIRTKDLEKARDWAREHCKEIALKKEGGALGAAVRSNDLTLGELFDAFRERGLPKYEKDSSKTYVNRLQLAMRLLEAVWGRGLRMDHLAQEHIDDFVEDREENGISVSSGSAVKRYPPVSRRTTRADLDALSTIVGWAHKQQHDGDWLLKGVSPFKRVDLPPEKSDNEISRPLADRERFEAEVEFASKIGVTDRHSGRRMLPMMLQLARHTGRRRQAVVNLRWRDICLDRQACEAALRRDQAPVKRAREWPHGAIHWRAEPNKMGYSSVIPITEELHDALLTYRHDVWPGLMDQFLGDNWKEEVDIAEGPLFPSPQTPTEPIYIKMSHRWLKNAQEQARQAGRRGVPSGDATQDGFHAYRRMWSTERGHYRSDWEQKALRVAGAWKPKGDTFRTIYLQIPADILYRVVANEESDAARSGLVSFKTVESLLGDVVERLSNGDADEKLRQFKDLGDDKRRRLVWDLVRAVEKNGARDSAASPGVDSQEVVKPAGDSH